MNKMLKLVFYIATAFNLVNTQASGCTTTGKVVTVSGFVMDNLCIDRGTLLDNPSVTTLLNPEMHSIHCLVDVKSCVDSEYTLLAPPNATSKLYSVKYQLGKSGTTAALKQAQSARLKGAVKGYSANVTGIDDGTMELKCVVFNDNIKVDGKDMVVTESKTNTASALHSNSVYQIVMILLVGVFIV
ncbi:hypothetical protein BC833DRAFT_601547 [Globomyces pollinis-pini]|nr:hypothetical protein BC833DRAFT_601547 [Globomyces pollinis-pini]